MACSVFYALFLSSAAAYAENRVALVIGNGSSYRSVPGLGNPTNDADDMAGALGRLGFAVTKVDNAPFDGNAPYAD